METKPYQSHRPPLRAAVFGVACHAVAPVVWFVFFVFIVPRFAAFWGSVTDGPEALPVAMGRVFHLSRFFVTYWYIYPIILAPFIVIDGIVCFRLNVVGMETLAWGWLLVVLLAESVLTLMLMSAVCSPISGTWGLAGA